MTDSKLAFILFEVGIVLTLVSMVLGPLGIVQWSISSAIVASFCAIAGIYLAFSSWNEDDEAPPPEEIKETHLEQDGQEPHLREEV